MATIAPDGTTLLSPEESIKKAETWLAEDYNLYAGVNIKPVETPPKTQAQSIADAQNYNDDLFTPLESIANANAKAKAAAQSKPVIELELDPYTVTQAQMRIALEGMNLKPPSDSLNSGYVAGAPSTAALSRGIVFGTIKDKNNKRRAHVCSFIDEMRKNVHLKKFIKSTAQKIREGIRYVMKMLGFSDTSGTFTYVTAKLKEAVRWLKTVQKFLKDVINFEKYVLAYITRIRAIIQWIMALPAKLIALLAQCLAKFLRLIKNVMTDFFKELTAGPSELGEALSAAKELVNESLKTVNLAATAATGAVVVVGAATTGLLVPVSASELSAANKTIANYSKTIPSGQPSTITQKKSTP